MWAWYVCNIYDKSDFDHGTDLDTYMQFCEDNGGIHYFHNLAFDGEFILSWLFRHGFTHDTKHRTRTFDTLISNTGKFYQLTITFERKNKRKAKQVIMRDSLKKLPFKVARIAEAFKLPTQKGELDHSILRPVGHKLTDEEFAYIRGDVEIVADALHEQFDHGLEKLTIGADALNMYKGLIGKNWDSLFPEFNLLMDADIRRAYRGGWTYGKPEHMNKVLGEGVVFDINSLYPYVMYEKPLPVGQPIRFSGQYTPSSTHPLYVQHFTCMCKLKPGKLPTLQVKNNPFFVETEYVTETCEPIEVYMSNVDIDLFFEHYDVDVIYWVGGWMFTAATGFFRDYIDYWTEIKVSSTGGKRELAKLMLNSLYGKFATNPDVTSKVPWFDEHGVVRYRLGEQEYRKPVYTPVGIFVTSWARDTTIRAAQAEYPRFVYADTDSLHLLGTELPKIEIHPSKLGAWKHEATFTRAKFLRAKTYMEEIDGEIHVTCAGLPDNLRDGITFDNFKSGLKIDGKLRPVHCPGGIVLQPTTFTVM